MIDCKGIGTYIKADISNPKTTGFLNMADGLRGYVFQKLIQRIFDIEHVD